MKNTFIVLLLIFMSCNKPFVHKVEKAESCLFHQDRFYFANFTDAGAYINSFKDDVIEKVFVQGLKRPKGIAAFEDMLLINDDTKIHFFSLDSKKIIRTLNVPGSIALNDLAIDDKGNFFSADSKAKIIFTGHVASKQVTPFFNVDFVPNGLLIDGEKLLLASWGVDMDEKWNTKEKGRLWQYEFGANKLEPFHDKRVGYLDGIAKLANNKYLVSAKRENEIYLFAQGKEPKLHSKGIGPADIAVSKSHLCIPSYSHGQIEFRKL